MRRAYAHLFAVLLSLTKVFAANQTIEEFFGQRPVLRANEEGLQLSPAVCEHLQKVQVCSHRGAASELGIEDGTLPAFQALYTLGIRCFDLDFIVTEDGVLLATHPARFQWALEELLPGEISRDADAYSLKYLRSVGFAAPRFPTMEQLLRELRKAMKQEHVPDGHKRPPLVFMDLKGPAFSTGTLQEMEQLAARNQIHSQLALFVVSPEQERVQQPGQDREILANGTQVTVRPHIDAAQLDKYTYTGPSILLDPTILEELRALGKPVYAWVVDDEFTLMRAMENRVHVISNNAATMRATVQRWIQRCMESAQE